MTLILCHLIAWTLGLLLDLVVGDPPKLPHPIRAIGWLIAVIDKRVMDPVMQRAAAAAPAKDDDDVSASRAAIRRPRREFFAGVFLCCVVLATTALVTAALLFAAYRVSLILGVVVEAVLTCWLLAARCLADESMKVCKALRTGDLEKARYAVSMIVGRDVARLDEAGVARAAVETVAENASDGVVAPALYAFLGGPVLGFLYKGINTMDSMVGYHNDRYEHFGKAAARLDDLANLLPSRLCAILMILAAFLAGSRYSGREACRIFRRDRYNHKSPNSAQTESACAGALGLRLAGDAWYFGKLVRKPYIGDARREIEPEDIPRACRLMFAAEAIGVVLALASAAAAWAITTCCG